MAATGQAKATPPAHAAVLPYAGFQLRAVAFILDCIVTASIGLIFFTIAFLPVALGGGSHISDSQRNWIYMVLLSYLPFVVFAFFLLWALRGQSPGMMAVRIEITDRDGEPLPSSRALVRALVWPLSMFPFGIGALPILFDEERRALHDMVAGTVVLEIP
jgi:uncharacterized RDD family membrane protein YckC